MALNKFKEFHSLIDMSKFPWNQAWHLDVCKLVTRNWDLNNYTAQQCKWLSSFGGVGQVVRKFSNSSICRAGFASHLCISKTVIKCWSSWIKGEQMRSKMSDQTTFTYNHCDLAAAKFINRQCRTSARHSNQCQWNQPTNDSIVLSRTKATNWM